MSSTLLERFKVLEKFETFNQIFKTCSVFRIQVVCEKCREWQGLSVCEFSRPSDERSRSWRNLKILKLSISGPVQFLIYR